MASKEYYGDPGNNFQGPSPTYQSDNRDYNQGYNNYGPPPGQFGPYGPPPGGYPPGYQEGHPGGQYGGQYGGQNQWQNGGQYGGQNGQYGGQNGGQNGGYQNQLYEPRPHTPPNNNTEKGLLGCILTVLCCIYCCEC